MDHLVFSASPPRSPQRPSRIEPSDRRKSFFVWSQSKYSDPEDQVPVQKTDLLNFLKRSRENFNSANWFDGPAKRGVKFSQNLAQGFSYGRDGTAPEDESAIWILDHYPCMSTSTTF